MHANTGDFKEGRAMASGTEGGCILEMTSFSLGYILTMFYVQNTILCIHC